MTRRDIAVVGKFAAGAVAATVGVAAWVAIFVLLFCWGTVFPTIGLLWLAGVL